MKTKNVPAETTKRIAGLEKKKADDMAAIAAQIKESETALTAAKKEKQNATERTDLKAYQDAKQKEAEATAAIEMYTTRYEQLDAREFVTTKDSDATIDALLQYEADIADEFIETITGPIEEIKKAHADYTGAVADTERVISAWTSRIHANYRSATTTYADGSNVSTSPVPVHAVPFTGCNEATLVGVFLEKFNSVSKRK